MGGPATGPALKSWRGDRWERPDEFGAYCRGLAGLEWIKFRAGDESTYMNARIMQVGPMRWVWGYAYWLSDRGSICPLHERNAVDSREEAIAAALAALGRCARKLVDEAETQAEEKMGLEYLKLIESHQNQGRLF